jgi:nucleoside 2-deoxyribosyltransferase
MKIYVAHQITGSTFDEVVDYYGWAREIFESFGYEVLCPMTAKGFLRVDELEKFKPKDYKNPISTNHAIYERDQWMVKECDVLYCDFTGVDRIPIGCIFEIAWAALLGKHVITVIPPGNILQHAFMLESSDITFENTGQAVDYLKYLAEGKIE